MQRWVELGARHPMGPCYVSETPGVRDLPALVHVVVTRRLPDGKLLGGSVIVDRTCLGVKDALVMRPMSQSELETGLHRMAEGPGGTGSPRVCEPLYAQSIVFHALDYAASLGFAPHADFHVELFGPRPPVLLETPLCRPRRPFYVSGPDDDVAAIMARLDAAVGRGHYDFVIEDEDQVLIHADDPLPAEAHDLLS